MKILFTMLVMLTGAISVNAQSAGFTLFQKSSVINMLRAKPAAYVCTCHTNQMILLLKSKANADWFHKMTKLTADTIQYAPSTLTLNSNISLASLPQLLNTTTNINIDNMPVAKLANTDKRMPIVKTDRTSYNMPIVGKSKVKGYSIYKTKSGADSVVAVK